MSDRIKPIAVRTATGIILSMLVGDVQAPQVPVPQTAAEVPGPAPGPLTKACEDGGSMAYLNLRA